MQVAISSSGSSLSSQVYPQFGRAPYILIVDSDTMQYEALENPNVASAGKAGIQTAQLVADKGAQAVLTGNVGPNAFYVLWAASIEVIKGVSGTVESAVKRYLQGHLQPVGPSALPSHFRGCNGLARRRVGGFGPGGTGPMAPMGTSAKNQPSPPQSKEE